MNYYFTKVVAIPFEEAEPRVAEALKAEGFGILTQIDVQATLKKKLDVDFRPYKILGACNPPFAWRALQAEDKIGVMLPCNVIIQSHPDGVEISAINPLAAMSAIPNANLRPIAEEIQSRLQRVIQGL